MWICHSFKCFTNVKSHHQLNLVESFLPSAHIHLNTRNKANLWQKGKEYIYKPFLMPYISTISVLAPKLFCVACGRGLNVLPERYQPIRARRLIFLPSYVSIQNLLPQKIQNCLEIETIDAKMHFRPFLAKIFQHFLNSIKSQEVNTL